MLCAVNLKQITDRGVLGFSARIFIMRVIQRTLYLSKEVTSGVIGQNSTRHVENLRSSHFWGFDVLNAKVDGRVVGRQLPVVPRGLKTGDQESSLLAHRLIREEGLLCSGSCGSAVAAALKAAKDLKAGQRCVVIQRSTSARSSTCGMKS
ncbi:hypothetical protein PF005_g3663 [Phytophthora fragariae]|uniref:Tryptophan synthase beta chain-like PALP domain-containing protein n=2 Tax=Phytophthora fragariae TaxID=53985 RepID=A0A6A3SB84_9STRA|nr:hypothetical protein PF007_g11144 [Phytophthora fragariae]KAE9229936.1 hypothetical protein PF005_g3663 [Phytophthora fragariae]